MLVLMQNLRHLQFHLSQFVSCLSFSCTICDMLSPCLFKTHPPNDCISFSRSTYFCNLSVFRYQDPCLVRCGVSCKVPTLFDCLLIALGLRQQCLVLSWQSQLCFSLPACTSNSPESTCCFSHAPPTLSTSPSVCVDSFQTADGGQPEF